MTADGDQRWVVRVRISKVNAWPSNPMTREAALEAMADFEARCSAVGDRWDFVEFEAYHGRVVRLRAREVLSIEVDHWKDRTHEGATGGSFTGTVTIQDGPAGADGPGIEFLRRQAAHSRQPVVR